MLNYLLKEQKKAFQFLLGRLKTLNLGQKKVWKKRVSIPLRQAKNKMRVWVIVPNKIVSIPLRQAKNTKRK